MIGADEEEGVVVVDVGLEEVEELELDATETPYAATPTIATIMTIITTITERPMAFLLCIFTASGIPY